MSRRLPQRRGPDQRKGAAGAPPPPPAVAPQPRRPRRLVVAAVCALLALAVALVFAKTVPYDFVNYDDDALVYENRHVADGLALEQIKWAWTAKGLEMWYPLTWMSYMLDTQVFGPDPWGYHLTNVLLHAAASVLLFLVLWRMTGNLGPSALVAAVFAVHPVQVETVAWVGERKGVLCGLFFVLTLAAYHAYASRPFSWWRYLLVIFLFGLGLATKPVMITAVGVLLLLDYWPLRRLDHTRGRSPCPLDAGRVSQPVEENPTGWETRPTRNRTCHRKDGENIAAPLLPRRLLGLLAEKLPLLLLAAAAALAAVWSKGSALQPLEATSLGWRMAHAVVSYAAYLVDLVWPVNLTVAYPRPQGLPPWWQLAGAGLLLVAISAVAVAWWRRRPYVLVGWLWYLGMMLPTIGLITFAPQIRADRYLYLPLIGLAVAVSWTLAGLVPARPAWRPGACLAAVVVVAALAACAYRQAGHWRDSGALWTHALECNPDNALAHNNLGRFLAEQGRLDEAIAHLRRCIALAPDNFMARVSLGTALSQRGRPGDAAEALAQYHEALASRGDYARALAGLGAVQGDLGHYAKAIGYCQRALAVRGATALVLPGDRAAVHYNLANALAQAARLGEAIAQYEAALALHPNHAEAHNNLGVVLVQQGELDRAIAHFQQAIAIRPQYADARRNLADAESSRARAKGAGTGTRD